jgi:DNA-binding transcriptional ArsR family regulator
MSRVLGLCLYVFFKICSALAINIYMRTLSSRSVQEDPELRRLLWYLLGGTRGGENRARIIRELQIRPSNLNQLATKLNLEYRTIKHHIEVLRKNSLVVSKGESYGTTYFLSQYLESHIDLFYEICKKVNLNIEASTEEKQ